MLYIHNYGIFSQLVYKAIKSFKLGATGPERFNLGKAQGRRMSARGRFVVPQEETEVVRCGWNNDSSSKFKKSSKTQPEVLLALTTFNLLLHMLVCVCVYLKFCCPFKNGGLEIPRVVVGPLFPLSCDKVESLPPYSVLGISLLFYEPLDLGPQRLKILLLERENAFRLKCNIQVTIHERGWCAAAV